MPEKTHIQFCQLFQVFITILTSIPDLCWGFRAPALRSPSLDSKQALTSRIPRCRNGEDTRRVPEARTVGAGQAVSCDRTARVGAEAGYTQNSLGCWSKAWLLLRVHTVFLPDKDNLKPCPSSLSWLHGRPAPCLRLQSKAFRTAYGFAPLCLHIKLSYFPKFLLAGVFFNQCVCCGTSGTRENENGC